MLTRALLLLLASALNPVLASTLICVSNALDREYTLTSIPVVDGDIPNLITVQLKRENSAVDYGVSSSGVPDKLIVYARYCHEQTCRYEYLSYRHIGGTSFVGGEVVRRPTGYTTFTFMNTSDTYCRTCNVSLHIAGGHQTLAWPYKHFADANKGSWNIDNVLLGDLAPNQVVSIDFATRAGSGVLDFGRTNFPFALLDASSYDIRENGTSVKVTIGKALGQLNITGTATLFCD